MSRHRLGTAIGLGLVLVTANLVFLGSTSKAATSDTLSLDAATFAFRPGSTHATAPPCVNAIAAPEEATEFNGTFNGKGGFFASVNLPTGATMTRFRFSVRDNDGDENAYAYLLRKRLAQPAAPVDGFLAYKVLAQTGSSGASMDLRQFTDATVDHPSVQNGSFAYFVEIVNCVDTVDPLGVQITYSLP